MELPFDPLITLLGLYPTNAETPIQKNLCIPMFIAAQFKISLKDVNAHSWQGHGAIESLAHYIYN